MDERKVTVDGIEMRWAEQGDGVPVVLIHGIPTSPALWRHVMPLISGARCLAWEMVGYGASIPAGRDRNISVAAQADYVVAWLRHVGVERAIFAGHDLGGGVAQIAAVRHPGMCSGLFLTNAICYDSWPIPSVKAVRATGNLVRHMPNAMFRQVLRAFYTRGHETSGQAEEAFQAHWPHYERHGGAEAFVRQVEALNVRDTLAVSDRLAKLRVPARVVWGAADQFQKIAYGERLSRDLNTPLRRVETGKHFTPEDHPEIVAEEISALVGQATTGAGTTASPSRHGGEAQIKETETPADRDRAIDRGMRLAAEQPEIMPDEADARIQPIYEDIQRTLRVPFVNLIFRTLANDPHYLETAWRQLGPVLRTRSFEAAADALRMQASLEPLPDRLETTDGMDDPDRLRAFNHSIHYVLPKLLLIVTALGEGGFGQAASEGTNPGASGVDGDLIPLGVADGTAKVAMIDPEEAAPPLKDLFVAIKHRHGYPLVSSYYRGLGNWPEFLQEVWSRIEPRVGSKDYEERKRILVEQALATVRNLPKAELGKAGPDGSGTDDTGAILTAFRFKFIPEMLIDVTLVKAMLDGPGAATSSPFSA